MYFISAACTQLLYKYIKNTFYILFPMNIILSKQCKKKIYLYIGCRISLGRKWTKLAFTRKHNIIVGFMLHTYYIKLHSP